MGITARGAWEAVKRHFRELGTDIQSQPTSPSSAIGDMSGDVFGNGMLCSPHALLAAFNHMHVFLDPDPDPAAATPSAGGCSSCLDPPGPTTTDR